MRLVSFEIATPLGRVIRTGAVDVDGRLVDLNAAWRARLVARDGLSADAANRIAAAVVPTDMRAFIENGDHALNAARLALEWVSAEGGVGPDGATLVNARKDVRLLAPIPRPPLIRDFMGFEEHLKNIYPRLGRDIPAQWYEMPVYYKGNPSSVGADGDTIDLPSYADSLDFEFEFAAVIGKGGINIPRERAMEHVYGFMIYDDFSARDIQQREMSVGLGPAKGKDFCGAHVFGPWLVTRDEIPDVYNLAMTAEVGGVSWCSSNTASMYWRFEDMIAHASRDETLLPAEILGSGTVGGGSAAERGEVLKRGASIVLRIDRLGTLNNQVRP